MEALMTKLWIGAALALMTTSAHAEVFNFGVNGGTARIEIPRNCRDIACLNLSYTDSDGKRYTTKDIDKLTTKTKENKDAPVTEAPVASPFGSSTQAPARPAAPAVAQPSLPYRAPVAAQRPVAPAPAYEPAPEPQRQVMDEQTYDRQPERAEAPAYAPQVAAPAREPEIAPPAREPERFANVRPEPVAPPARPAPVGPLGEWLVEDGSAQIRIEECGANLCGYVAQSTTPNDTDRKNSNPTLRKRPVIGLPILIDMKPGKARWDGNIYNPKDGSTYTAHISMRNTNTLRVEGCAFGGLFCGGQNWKRVM
jgi:uncharacterized protein (DUF2147 family)